MPPVFVTVSDKLDVVDTATLPKLRLVGFDPSAPADAVPVPESEIVSVGFEALDVTVTLPLAAPADVGLNETLKVVLWPAVKVIGVEAPLTLNPVPLAAI